MPGNVSPSDTLRPDDTHGRRWACNGTRRATERAHSCSCSQAGNLYGWRRRARQRDGPDDGALLALFRAIASRDDLEIARRLDSSRDLAICPIRIGASRQDADDVLPCCDSSLRLQRATRRCISLLPRINENSPSRSSREAPTFALVTEGELNRSTTPPTGVPARTHRDPVAQRDVITYLIEAGADPNALDKSGVAPLHRAVRNRCSAAVSALIENGADPRLMNKNGSTPLHLAVQNTGKSNSGSEAAKDEQGRIIVLLLGHGASADRCRCERQDRRGRSNQRLDP